MKLDIRKDSSIFLYGYKFEGKWKATNESQFSANKLRDKKFKDKFNYVKDNRCDIVGTLEGDQLTITFTQTLSYVNGKADHVADPKKHILKRVRE